MPESTEGIEEGATTAMDYENESLIHYKAGFSYKSIVRFLENGVNYTNVRETDSSPSISIQRRTLY